MSSTLVTPEAVLLELPTAGVATRAFARLVDLLLQLIFAAAVGSLGAVLIGPAVSPTLFFIALAFTSLLVVPIGMELVWRGSSLGKAMFGLRVVGADGAPEAPRQAVVRGLVALVDLYLSLGAVAIGAAMFSTRTQRAGDMAAGTVVIRARPTGSVRTPIAFHPPVGHEAYVASLDVGLLRDEDFSLIREFLLRTRNLGPQRRAELAMQLATSIQQQIRHQLGGPIDPELWLICVASAYQQRQGGLLSDAAAGLAPLAAVVPSSPAPPRRRSSRRTTP